MVVTHIPETVFTEGLVLKRRYRLDEPLVLSQITELWRGHDLVLQRAVAVKLLHPRLAVDPAISERFRQEAISAARLSHPHIVPTYDAGIDGDISFIVLGLVEGPSLTEVLSEDRLTPHDTITIVRQITDALDYAHDHGLIHRNIKPSNVLVVDSKRIMVTDFGIAGAIAEKSTGPNKPPEQIQTGTTDGRSDIYATGVLLQQMLSTQTSPAISSDLEAIIAKATMTDPDDRYQRASEFREALSLAEQTTNPTPTQIRTKSAQQSGSEFEVQPKPLTRETVATHMLPRSPHAEMKTATKSVYAAVPELRIESKSNLKRLRTITIVVVVALVLISILIGRFVAQIGSGPNQAKTSTTEPVLLTSASSFDPNGSDHTENESQVKNVIDGNEATTWSTETYITNDFGRLKDGVGVVLSLNKAGKLKTLSVNSSTQNWSASIYLTSNNKADLTSLKDWGQPVASQSAINGDTKFDLSSVEGSSALLWITDLGTSSKFSTSEIQVSA